MVSPSIASATDRAPVTWRTVCRLALMVVVLLFLIVPHLCYRAVGRPSPMVMAFLNAAGWIAGRVSGLNRMLPLAMNLLLVAAEVAVAVMVERAIRREEKA